jgi:hypothetical protein
MENADPPKLLPGAEQIMQVCAVHDGIVLSTSLGRVVYLRSNSGAVRWQTQLIDHPLNRLLACDDFTVLQITYANHNVALATLDNYDGQMLSLRKSVPNVTPFLPINVALSDDGLLVWTLRDRIMACDLYEPGDAAMDSTGGSTKPLNPIYRDMRSPDQLRVVQNNVLAMCSNSDGVHLIIHPLSELEATLNHESHAPKALPLSTEAQKGSAFIRLGGAWVYCVGPKWLQAYHLANASENAWTGKLSQDLTPDIHDAFVGKDYLVLLDEPGSGLKGPAKSIVPLHLLQMFSRQHVVSDSTHESGQLMIVPRIADPSGILQWQAVDGGFYYRSGDNKLHFLRGARVD